ncbi:hypothetical protein CPB83DRAFT_890333 [Crepidotus variabilis]|uniref:Secreted protein n=1 Tax=Crepidotus variabilis TaxID=179855 RepID=A0A9P6EQG7_9AGAR|nr:hypothetical protein CPB83DRAFT_890333 [Crepidotus variabilis]
MNITHLLSSILCFLVVAYAATPSVILPANGTSINPGQTFDFQYQSIADNGVSSYNYTVWLFTSPPTTAFATLENFASGYYFGRFAEPNFPGNPSPPNLPPAKLTMPNFATLEKGFGVGATGHNVTCYVTVLEEYATGTGTLGYRMSLSSNYIFYNNTGKALKFEVPFS